MELPENAASVFRCMKSYVSNNKAEITKVSKNYLKQKGVSLETYVESINNKSAPFNELFLILFIKIFRIHVGVILANSGFWCDTPWIPSQQCGLIFMFTSTGSQGVSPQTV